MLLSFTSTHSGLWTSVAVLWRVVLQPLWSCLRSCSYLGSSTLRPSPFPELSSAVITWVSSLLKCPSRQGLGLVTQVSFKGQIFCLMWITHNILDWCLPKLKIGFLKKWWVSMKNLVSMRYQNVLGTALTLLSQWYKSTAKTEIRPSAVCARVSNPLFAPQYKSFLLFFSVCLLWLIFLDSSLWCFFLYFWKIWTHGRNVLVFCSTGNSQELESLQKAQVTPLDILEELISDLEQWKVEEEQNVQKVREMFKKIDQVRDSRRCQGREFSR